ncbi:MAG TPA: hypothetical protein VHZ03_38265 [Trebonia sp.]|nr:hypothetical protein [Trebonia sp.]
MNWRGRGVSAVPNTISDEQAASLAERAAKADNTDWANPTPEEGARADRDDHQLSRRHLS